MKGTEGGTLGKTKGNQREEDVEYEEKGKQEEEVVNQMGKEVENEEQEARGTFQHLPTLP